MKKIFSMFLILIMILPMLPVNASEDVCLIEFSDVTPTYSISGTMAYISNHYGQNPVTVDYSGKTGWVLNPTSVSSQAGYDHTAIDINLADDFMHRLDGNRDVLMDVCYYDGSSSDAGNKFCVYYNSHNHTNENAGVITLGGSGTWKTHTFVLEQPKFNDVGVSPLRNLSIAVKSTYMGTSAGKVAVSSAKVYYGDVRRIFFDIKSENVGNIFFNTQPVVFDMDFRNPNDFDNGVASVVLAVRGNTNNFSYNITEHVAVGTNESFTHKINLDELDLPFGTYELSADVYINGELADCDTEEFSRINAVGDAVIADDVTAGNFMGINTHSERFDEEYVAKSMYLAKKSGVDFVRTTFGWEGTEKSEGNYEISNVCLRLVEEANKNGLKLMVVLGNSNPGVYPNYKPWRTGSTEENFQQYLSKYSAYVEYVVSKLKDKVECWEIYNEYTYDYPGYSTSDAAVTATAAADYAEILKAGYEAVKRADPDARVIGGAIGGGHVTDKFAGVLYDTYDAADYMDAVSFHNYCGGVDTSAEINNLVTDIEQLTGYIDGSASDDEIYLDEFNFVTTGVLDSQEQALYNVRFLVKERYLDRIDRIYPYALEGESYNQGNGYYFTKRPADDYDYLATTSAARPNYVTFSFMNKLLKYCKSVAFSEDNNGNYIYEFYDEFSKRPVYVIWNKTDSPTVSHSVTINNSGTELISYDMYGNELSTGTDSLAVTTGREPVYVTTPKDYFHIGQDNDAYKISLSGVAGANSDVSFVVLKKGISEDDFESSEHLLYMDQKRTDSEGEWSFTFKVTQGNGEYRALLMQGDGTSYDYTLTFDAGKMRVSYVLTQANEEIKKLADIADGNINIDYRIDNPENKQTSFSVFGCFYKGDTLVDVVKSPDSQLAETDLIKTGSITIPDVKKSEIDKVQILILDGTNNLKPLYQKFVLE